MIAPREEWIAEITESKSKLIAAISLVWKLPVSLRNDGSILIGGIKAVMKWRQVGDKFQAYFSADEDATPGVVRGPWG